MSRLRAQTVKVRQLHPVYGRPKRLYNPPSLSPWSIHLRIVYPTFGVNVDNASLRRRHPGLAAGLP
ncbi:MAG: hypothetical protein NTZ50_03465, partial [Chloroflexi bacterium]|nr:hypothetical protein [Chloroflexota bacterium]